MSVSISEIRTAADREWDELWHSTDSKQAFERAR